MHAEWRNTLRSQTMNSLPNGYLVIAFTPKSEKLLAFYWDKVKKTEKIFIAEIAYFPWGSQKMLGNELKKKGWRSYVWWNSRRFTNFPIVHKLHMVSSDVYYFYMVRRWGELTVSEQRWKRFVRFEVSGQLPGPPVPPPVVPSRNRWSIRLCSTSDEDVQIGRDAVADQRFGFTFARRYDVAVVVDAGRAIVAWVI